MRGFSLTNKCFLCHSKKETVDHILVYCAKTRILCQLFFTLFGVSWVLSSSVKDALPWWHGSFLSKVPKKPWKVASLYIFWTVWKERNILAFDNTKLLVQKMKNCFVCNLWSWYRMSIDVGPMSLLSFIDWLGSKWGQVLFFVLSLPCLVEPFGSRCMLPLYFGKLFWCFLSFLYVPFVLPIKKMN